MKLRVQKHRNSRRSIRRLDNDYTHWRCDTVREELKIEPTLSYIMSMWYGWVKEEQLEEYGKQNLNRKNPEESQEKSGTRKY